MILTVTPNTTLDLTVIIPGYTPNKTIRSLEAVYSTGGKPTDASLILGEIGIPSTAIGLAAGAPAMKVEALLRARGVQVEFFPAGGETRINVVIVAKDDHSHTTITTSTLEVEPAHLEALNRRYAELLPQAAVVVIGGALPRGMQPSYYAEAISQARALNIPVIFDAAEPNLSAGLAARPTYIKPNQDELSALVGRPITSVDDAYRAGRELYESTGVCPIITLGSAGGLAILPDRAYRIPPLKIEVASAGGAGDAVLAGLAAAIYQRQPIEEGLRLGFAAAAAVCLLPGTADCRREDVERLLPQVELIPYVPDGSSR